MFSAYHALIAHVTNNHDTYQPPQEQQLLIRSSNKAWNVFAEAYLADARDFVVHVPKWSLPAFLNWKLNYEDPTQLVTAPLIPPFVIEHSLLSPLSGEVISAASVDAASSASVDATPIAGANFGLGVQMAGDDYQDT
mgnify:CR=1 FL=1